MTEETKAPNLTYEDLNLPNYINTRHVLAGLNVADLAKAAVIAGLNLLLVGDTGTGKTQLAKDIYNGFFRGNKAEGGHGVFVKANPEIDINNEIFTRLNIDRAQRERTQALDSLVYFVDEINRAPPIAQNQFFGLGDGNMDYQGRDIPIGKDGYHLLIATANMGNGEFSGTFDSDKALLNRLHVAIDLEHCPFKPTYGDKQEIRARKANPNVLSAPKRDITDKILAVSREISDKTANIDLETRAVLDYLEFGLQNCQKYPLTGKDRAWPMVCQGCEHNKEGDNKGKDALCSQVRAPETRTMEVVRKYALALEYLAKLKDPSVKVESYELIFKAFELTGAYQHLLNPVRLRDHYGHNPRLMAEVVKDLQADYEKARPYILTSLEMAGQGKGETVFFNRGEQFGLYNALSDKAKKSVGAAISPFSNQRAIGLGWVNNLVELTIKESEKRLRSQLT